MDALKIESPEALLFRGLEPPGLANRSREAAVEFEAYVLKMLLTQMRATVGEGGLFQSRTLRGYDAMLDDALARRAAEAGSFGLANQLMRQWGVAE